MTQIASNRQNDKQLAFVGFLAFFAFVSVVAGVVLIGQAGGASQIELSLVLMAAVALSFPVGAAMLERPYNILHPLNFVALSLFIGVFGRTLFILSSNSDSVAFLLDGRGVESLFPGAVLSLTGSFLLCLGYAVSGRVSFRMKTLSGILMRFNSQNFILLLPILFLIAGVAMALFLKETGFEYTSLSSLSAKRRVDTGDGQLKASLGYHRMVAQEMPKIIFLILGSVYLRGNRSFGIKLGLAAFSFLTVILPFIGSSRAGVLMTMIAFCVAINFIRGLSVQALLTALGISLFIIFAMLALRRVNTRGAEFSTSMVEQGLEPIFGGRNFADITKLSHIYEAVPSKLDYKYGSSFISLIYAPIPRTSWPEKPAITMGYELTQVLYGREAGTKLLGGGTPPGIFAESLINFGVWGFPITVFFAGVFLRTIVNTIHRMAEDSDAGVALYAGVVPAFTLMLLSGDFTRALIILLGTGGIVALLCLLSRIQLLPTR